MSWSEFQMTFAVKCLVASLFTLQQLLSLHPSLSTRSRCIMSHDWRIKISTIDHHFLLSGTKRRRFLESYQVQQRSPITCKQILLHSRSQMIELFMGAGTPTVDLAPDTHVVFPLAALMSNFKVLQLWSEMFLCSVCQWHQWRNWGGSQEFSECLKAT